MKTLSTAFAIALAFFFFALSWMVADYIVAFIFLCVLLTQGMST